MEKNQKKITERVKVTGLYYSPQKMRLIADLVRGKTTKEAIGILKVLNKKGAPMVRKAIESAIANINYKHGFEPERMYISEILVDEESNKYSKKGRFVSRAGHTVLVKRKSKLSLVVSEK